jgi:hypothetical protein
MNGEPSRKVRLYLWTRKKLAQLVALLESLFAGFWLGVFDSPSLHSLDKHYYDRQREYQSEEYNRRGLTGWEDRAIRAHFGGRKRILVIGAGGGREVLALSKAGFEVDGYECHPTLVSRANRLLSEDGAAARVELLPRDEAPAVGRTYDGLIVGWGTYMHIQGRERRIAFLAALRQQVPLEAPLLVSFYDRDPAAKRFTFAAAIGSAVRWALRRPRVEVGDGLVPIYVHFFTEQEIKGELAQAGFELVLYQTEEYGHAVGLAAEPTR